MLKRILILVFALLLFAINPAQAIEVVRQKNAATYIIFPIVDADGDPVSSATGLDSELNYFADGSAPQASFSDCTNEATEIGSTGMYYLSLTAGELNHDYDIIQVKTTSSGAKTQVILIRTIVGDPLNLATSDDGGTINVTGGAIDTVSTATAVTTVNGLAANTITATSIASDAITAAKIAASAITSSEFAQSAADLVWSTAARTLTAGTNIVLAKGTGVTGFNDITAANVWDTNISAYSGAGYAGTYLKALYDKRPTNYFMGSSVQTDKDDEIDAIKAKTDYLPSATAGAAGGVFIAGSNAATTVNFTGNLSGSVGSVTGAVGSVTAGVTVTTNNDKTGYALSAAGVDALWDELVTGHTTASSYGKLLTDNIDAAISSRSTLTTSDNIGINWADISNPTTSQNLSGTTISTSQGIASVSGAVGSVTGNVGGSVASVTGNVGGNVTGTIGGLTAAALADMFDTNSGTTYASAVAGSVVKEIADNAGGSSLTVAQIADGVWDEAIADHLTAGTTGNKLNSAASAGDPWTTSLPGSYTSGQAGYILGTYLNAAITSRSSHSASDVWSVGARTLTAGTNIVLAKGTGITGFNDIAATDVWSATTRTLSAGTNIVLAKGTGITGFNDIAASDVWGYGSGRTITGGTVTTNSDKTGYSLSQTFPTNFSSLAITVGGAVTAGTVSDKTGYALTQSFPTNFSSLAITAGGAVTAGTVSDKTGYTVSTVSDKTGYSLSASGIDSIWDEVASGHTTAGTFGRYLDKQLTTLNDITAESVWAVGTRTLTSGAYSGLTSSDIDAIWDELKSGHTTAGSFGYYIDAQISGVGGGTAADIADAVWDEVMSGHTTTGTAGKYLSDAQAAGNPWETDISTGYTGLAGAYVRSIYQNTNGAKDDDEYQPLEKMIRSR